MDHLKVCPRGGFLLSAVPGPPPSRALGQPSSFVAFPHLPSQLIHERNVVFFFSRQLAVSPSPPPKVATDVVK